MLIINTTPLGSHKYLSDYASFLIRRFIITQTRRGVHEVHIIFDNPGQLPNTPKQFEQKRRDKMSAVTSGHICIEMQNDTPIEMRKWREKFLNCRFCKRNILKYLGQYILANVGTYLTSQQKVYVAGARDDTTAWFIEGEASPEPEPLFASNAEETDSRIWLHVSNCTAAKVLVV